MIILIGRRKGLQPRHIHRPGICTLGPIFQLYAKERNEGEHFGDFVIRAGYVEATVQGGDFHKNIKAEALSN